MKTVLLFTNILACAIQVVRHEDRTDPAPVAQLGGTAEVAEFADAADAADAAEAAEAEVAELADADEDSEDDVAVTDDDSALADADEDSEDDVAVTDDGAISDRDGPPQKKGYQCCCKEADECRKKGSSSWWGGKKKAATASRGDDGDLSEYHAEQGLCCKRKKGGCQIGTKGKYNQKVDEWMCVEGSSKTPRANWNLAPPPPREYEDGTMGHTLKTRCKTRGEDADMENKGKDEARNDIASMVHQMEGNSLDIAADDMFSIYTCIRWAPDSSYVPLAQDELSSEILPEDSDTVEFAMGEIDPEERGGAKGQLRRTSLLMARAVERGNFVPMRCSQNIKVYEDGLTKKNNFVGFEEQVKKVADFFEKEAGGLFDKRSKEIEESKGWTGVDALQMLQSHKKGRWDEILEHSQLFSEEAVGLAVEECTAKFCPDDECPEVELTSALLKGAEGLEKGGREQRDCDFARWWEPKLQMYLNRFPFQSFISSKEGASLDAGDRVLICFGKRIGGELHRRKEGSHILTEMNGLGCQGFWDFKRAGKLLKHITALWAPPTCQFQALKIEMKMKMLEMILKMSEQLFDSLPSDIMAENFGEDIQAEHAAGLTKVGANMKYAVSGLWSNAGAKREMLGSLLYDAHVKWAVCPIDEKKKEGIDEVLGGEDLASRQFTRKAFAKYATGEDAKQPGEVCGNLDEFLVESKKDAFLADASHCSIGTLRENSIEPFKDIPYSCPVTTMLKPDEQLAVFQQYHPDTCLVYGAKDANWPYKGLNPTARQYKPEDHLPKEGDEFVQIMEKYRDVDSEGVMRTFLKLARYCTVAQRRAYPKWCNGPEFVNPVEKQSLVGKVASAVGSGMKDVAHHASGIFSSDKNVGRKLLDGWRWAGRRAAGSVRTIQESAQGGSRKLGGATKARLDRIEKARLYEGTEGGATLHRMAFHVRTDLHTKTSATDFDRFLVTVPCAGLDVEAQIASDHETGEAALELLAKVGRKGVSMDKPHLAVEVRGEAELRNVGNVGGPAVGIRQQLAWRETSLDGEYHDLGPWRVTHDADLRFLEDMLLLGDHSVHTTMPKQLFAVRLTYQCGKRKDLYEQEHEADGGFSKCVHDAARAAKKTKRKEVLTLEEYDEEVVVQVRFEKIAGGCQKKTFANREAYKQVKKKKEEGKEEVVEKVHFGRTIAAWEEGKMSNSCTEASPSLTSGSTSSWGGLAKGAAPQERKEVEAAWMGAALPYNMRTEVILDATDVYVWIKAKGWF